LALFAAAFSIGTAWSQSITTYHYDNYRTGWNQNETTLTPFNVNSSSFAVLESVPVDDQVDAQPLYMPGVNITAGAYPGTHNVVYVATEATRYLRLMHKAERSCSAPILARRSPTPWAAITMAPT